MGLRIGTLVVTLFVLTGCTAAASPTPSPTPRPTPRPTSIHAAATCAFYAYVAGITSYIPTIRQAVAADDEGLLTDLTEAALDAVNAETDASLGRLKAESPPQSRDRMINVIDHFIGGLIVIATANFVGADSGTMSGALEDFDRAAAGMVLVEAALQAEGITCR